MAEYKRWMAYLYNYENGFKKNCIGTARIERRGKEAKVTVSIQAPSLANEVLQNLFYIRTSEGVRGISAGEYLTNGSGGNWQIHMDANDMGGSGLELERMDGYLICKDGNKYFASAWDDKPLLPTEVYELLHALEEQRNNVAQPDRIELPTEEDAYQEQDGLLEESEQNDVEMNEIAEDIGDVQTPVRSAERIFELCPVIWPFAEPWAERCIKLELEDIGLLPAEHWQLTTNSFLMHSYYGYRHLVLARVRDGARYRYELLVPGIYNEREKEIAELFGFAEFHNTKSRPIATGEYGYWSMPVVFERDDGFV